MTTVAGWMSLFHCQYCGGKNSLLDETSTPWYHHIFRCCATRELGKIYEPVLLPYLASYLTEPTVSGLISVTPGLLEGTFYWDKNNKSGYWEVKPPATFPTHPPISPYGIATTDVERGIVAIYRSKYEVVSQLTHPVVLFRSSTRKIAWRGTCHDITTTDGQKMGCVQVADSDSQAYLLDNYDNVLVRFTNSNYIEAGRPRKMMLDIPQNQVSYSTRDQMIVAVSHSNQQPAWNDAVNAYVLKFHNHRVTDKSVRNFLFQDADRFMLQFGRIKDSRTHFTLDVDQPFSPLLAYAVAAVSCLRLD